MTNDIEPVNNACDGEHEPQSLPEQVENGYSKNAALAFKLIEEASFVFRSLEDAKALSIFLSVLCPNNNEAALGLMELMVNGIEHGNLEISFDDKSKLLENGKWHEEVATRLAKPEYFNRTVTIEFKRSARKIDFFITDQGKGFDAKPYLVPQETPADRESLLVFHGRGIKMASQMCFDEVEYIGIGNQVRATIFL